MWLWIASILFVLIYAFLLKQWLYKDDEGCLEQKVMGSHKLITDVDHGRETWQDIQKK